MGMPLRVRVVGADGCAGALLDSIITTRRSSNRGRRLQGDRRMMHYFPLSNAIDPSSLSGKGVEAYTRIVRTDDNEMFRSI